MIFIKSPKETNGEKINPINHTRKIFPILDAQQLLSHPRRQLLLKKIAHACGLSATEHDALYTGLITQFVEFSQAIPSMIGGKLGGLMDDALERCNMVLQIYQENEQNKFDTRYAYALFSAALLLDVGKIITQQKIIISDEQGGYLDEWNPFTGCINHGNYYRMRPLGGSGVILGRYVTPILARQLMPEVGFLWIEDDYKLFQMWLAMLLDDTMAGGLLAHLLNLCVQRLEELRPKKEELLPPLAIVAREACETEHGDDFVDWLTQGLESKKITVNQPGSKIHIVDEGMFLESRIFDDFCKGYDKCKNAAVVIKQFNDLGFTRLSGADLQLKRYFFESSEARAKTSTRENNRYFLRQTAATRAALDAKHIREGLLVARPDLFHLPQPSSLSQQLISVVKERRAAKLLTKLLQRHPSLKKMHRKL